MGRVSISFAGTLLLVAFCGGALSDQLTGRPSIIDGDTLEIHGARIRLRGIDAPETDQLCRKEGSDQYRSAHAVLFLSAPSSDYFVEGLIGTQGDTVPIAKQLKIELQNSRVVIFQK
jgi:hypothetical protein